MSEPHTSKSALEFLFGFSLNDHLVTLHCNMCKFLQHNQRVYNITYLTL